MDGPQLGPDVALTTSSPAASASPQAVNDDQAMEYTQEDAKRVFEQPADEVHAHFARLAAEKREDIERAIRALMGTED